MLRTSSALLLGSVFCVFSCGGQIDTGDAGSGSDSSTHPPPSTDASPPPWADASPPPVFDGGGPPPLCGPMAGGGTVSSNGDCTVTEDWSCADTKYSISCTCPAKQCTCSQYTANGGSGTMIPYYNGCPSCPYSGKQLAQLCGFPSN